MLQNKFWNDMMDQGCCLSIQIHVQMKRSSNFSTLTVLTYKQKWADDCGGNALRSVNDRKYCTTKVNNESCEVRITAIITCNECKTFFQLLIKFWYINFLEILSDLWVLSPDATEIFQLQVSVTCTACLLILIYTFLAPLGSNSGSKVSFGSSLLIFKINGGVQEALTAGDKCVKALAEW